MSLGDFIGSLQFYPWKERMLMPEEEPVERVPSEVTRIDSGQAASSAGENDRRKRFRVPRRTARNNRRSRKPKGETPS
jgi:hypothetical protein